jgi:Ketosteroid isomerase-related protein
LPDRVELSRKLLAAFNDRDVEAACEVTDPDVKFTVIAEQVTGDLPDGHEGLRQWFAAAGKTWEQLQAEPSEVAVEERGDWVIIDGITRARARGTRKRMDFPWTAVAKVEGGKVVHFGVYLDRLAALEAIEED